MEKATTMEAPKAARIEHFNKYPTRYSNNVTTNFTDASGSRTRYNAATHLASAIKSDNIFTMMVIEEIAESIDALIGNNVKDPTNEDYRKKEKKERKKNEILAKNADMTQKHITAVKHWSPPSFYCSALPDLSLVLFPEMSVSQPFPKGFGDE
jgi:hypothetical protein